MQHSQVSRASSAVLVCALQTKSPGQPAAAAVTGPVLIKDSDLMPLQRQVTTRLLSGDLLQGRPAGLVNQSAVETET